MIWLLAAIIVIIALLFLTRRKPASQNLETVAPPRPAGLTAEGAVTAAELDAMNQAAKERRHSALCARWWSV